LRSVGGLDNRSARITRKASRTHHESAGPSQRSPSAEAGLLHSCDDPLQRFPSWRFVMTAPEIPQRHNFDKHANDIAQHVADGDLDELLRPKYVIAKLQVSNQWLNSAYKGGYGPPCVELSPRVRRYPRGEFVKYLRMRGNIYKQQMAAAKLKKAAPKPASKQTKPAPKPNKPAPNPSAKQNKAPLQAAE